MCRGGFAAFLRWFAVENRAAGRRVAAALQTARGAGRCTLGGNFLNAPRRCCRAPALSVWAGLVTRELLEQLARKPELFVVSLQLNAKFKLKKKQSAFLVI